MATPDNLKIKLKGLVHYGLTYELIVGDQSGVAARENEGNRFFNGESVKYSSLNEELVDRINRLEKSEYFMDWNYLKNIPEKNALVLMLRYSDLKPSGEPNGSVYISKKMGVSKETARKLINQSEALMEDYYRCASRARLH